MRKSLIILSLFLSLFSFAQSDFSNGFSDGYKKGYCQNQGIGCMSPLPPIAPIPNVNENMNSYQDGYNRGFEAGLNAQKSKTDNSTSSTRQRFQTSKAEFIDFTSNTNPSGDAILDLKIKAISTIVERAKENLENENYDAAIDNSNDLLNIQPNLGIAFIIKSNAQFHKGEIINAYNNSAKANNILSNSSSKNWYDFMYKEMSEYLSQYMKNSYFSDVQKTCEAFWYKNNLSNYFLGLSHYYQNDFKSAKKAFKKVDDFEPAKKYIESIENKTNIPNPYLNFKKEITENYQLNKSQTNNVQSDENELEEIINLFKVKKYEEIIERLKPFENKIDRNIITDKNIIFRVYGSLTYCFYFTKNFEQTVKYSTKTINNSLIKENGELYFIRAMSKSRLDDYFGANTDYDYLIKNYSTINCKQSLATLLNNKAYNLVLLKDYKSAKPLIDKALSLDKNSDYIWSTEGELEYKLGNYSECIKAMNEALKLKETDNSYYYRGLANIKLGNKINGCKDLSKAGELGSSEAYNEINKYCK